MKRHRLDVLSLTAGLLFVGTALAFLVGSGTVVDLRLAWVWPVTVALVGVAVVLSAIRRTARRRDPRPAPRSPDDER